MFGMRLTCARHGAQAAMARVRQDGGALRFASVELKCDWEFVIEAVRQNSRALQYASEELKGDREVVIKAVRQHGRARKHASEELRALKGGGGGGRQAEW